jgi:inorganic triphosphatase YgiF
MPLEPELKFRVPNGRLRSVAEMRIKGARLGRRTDSKIDSTYFDTPKQKLRRCGLALRVRRLGDEFRQTVKSSAVGGFARGEWEAELSDGAPSFRDFHDTPLEAIATKKLKRKLEPIFRTSVDRVARPLDVGASEIELAVDHGKLLAGRRTRPIEEYELELKKGRAVDLFRIAREFERRAGGELDLRSKSERGYLLASGDTRIAVHAESIELSSEMTASEAFDVIAFSALRHFTSNADGVRQSDPEAVHQMRVGLRRLRAAISLFGTVLPPASTEKIKAELKWLTRELAPAREIDVFLKEKIKPLERFAEPKRGVRAIEKQFSNRRKQAFGRARVALATARYRKLAIDVLEWLDTRKADAVRKSDTPVGKFAERVLRRRIKKVRKEGVDLADLSAPQRHKLRIKIKKIRYAFDFFRSLYTADMQDDFKRLSKHSKKSQDALGALNDFIAHREMAADAALHAPRRDRRARAFASGLLVGEEREASRTLLKVASKAIRKLKPSSVKLR